MPLSSPRHHRRAALPLALLLLVPACAIAGGPKYIAGTSFFNPAVVGQPVHWASGQVNYFVDQGPLSGSVSNQQATAMVDAAAALWSAVPTAGVTLTDVGPLNEDVNGSNIAGELLRPDHRARRRHARSHQLSARRSFTTPKAPSSTPSSAPRASQPDACQNNAVYVWMDNLNPDATIAHAVIVLNGLCATNPSMLQMMSFELERAFGRVLGLDYAQVNPGAATNGEAGGTQGWPIMEPLSGACGANGGACIPDPTVLRYDDIAALNRIYPITAANLANFPGKQLTAANTISIQGSVSFRTGYGMQGVNVVARPLDANGNPLYQYTVTAVTGALFSGNHGNPITGFSDPSGNLLAMWGSNDPALQGSFDLSGIPLPPGMTTASYQISFEAIDPLYILENSVGPYTQGQVAPSGTLSSITLSSLSAGSTQTLTVTASDTPVAGFNDAIGSFSEPRPMPTGGLWCGRLSQIGQTDWFTFPVRGNRIFTVVTEALDETGAPSNAKAMPTVGVWDAFDSAGATPIGAAPGLNGLATGETWLRVASNC